MSERAISAAVLILGLSAALPAQGGRHNGVDVSVGMACPMQQGELTRLHSIRFDAPSLTLSQQDQASIVAGLQERLYHTDSLGSELAESARSAWQQRGYVKAETDARVASISRDANGPLVDAIVFVEEGLQYKLKVLVWEHAKAFSAAQLDQLTPLKPGDVFNVEYFSQLLVGVRRLYVSHGFVNFDVTPGTSFDDSTHQVTLRMDLREDEAYRVRNISIAGLPGDRRDSVFKLLLEHWAGKLLDTDAFAQSVRQAVTPDNLAIEFQVATDEKSGAADIALQFKPQLDCLSDSQVRPKLKHIAPQQSR